MRFTQYLSFPFNFTMFLVKPVPNNTGQYREKITF